MDFIIVGAGLFGSMTARALRADGHHVTVVDDRDTSCSKASGCLIKPSWLLGMTQAKRDMGMIHLMNHYGHAMREVDLTVNIAMRRPITVHHLPPEAVLLNDDEVTSDAVYRIEPDGRVYGDINGRLEGIVIVCAGVGTPKLLPQVHVKGLMGVSLVFPDQQCQPSLKVWAPYKQAVCVNGPRGVWFGNGTAIKPENWSPEYIKRAEEQARDFFGLEGYHEVQVGVRPYVPGQNGLLHQISDKLWVNTGGAKSGAVLAAAHAEQLRLAYGHELFR